MPRRSPTQACRPYAFALVAALFMGSTWACPISAQTVRGIVTEDGSGESIEGVRLILRSPDGLVRATAISSDAGRFELAAESSGTVRLEVTHLGYADWETANFALAPDVVIDVEVRLGIEAIPLEPITVIAQSSARRGRLADFERRMSDPGRVGGYFLTEKEIERRPMATASTLVLATPGMSTRAIGAGALDRRLILTGQCVANVFIDGVRLRQSAQSSVDDLLSPDLIAGVEMYPRGLTAPLQYQGASSPNCGVVLFWTKGPRIGESRGWGAKRIAAGLGLLIGLLTVGFIG